MNFKRKGCKNNGITLIALVITVIVLLILAGVSINGILGQGSVVNQAKQAKTQTNNKQEEESISVAMTEAVGNSDLSREVIEEKLSGQIQGKVNGLGSWTIKGNSGNNYIITQDGEVILVDIVSVESFANLNTSASLPAQKNTIITKGTGADQQQIVIPAGFKIADDSGNTLEEGIVIEDSNQNQFVWVPVNQTLTFKNTTGESETTTGSIKLGRYEFDENNKTISGPKDGEYGMKTNYGGRTTETSSNSVAKNIEAFKKKTNIAKGYYIGRYEMGKDGGTVVCQKGKTVYNNVTRDKAVEESQNLYNNTQGMYTSDLINSFAWDTAIVYIDKCSGTTDYAFQKDGGSSNPKNTGTNSDEQCKINDMAKNVREWSTEYVETSSSYINRGADFSHDSILVSTRATNKPDTYNNGIGFRSILYLQF